MIAIYSLLQVSIAHSFLQSRLELSRLLANDKSLTQHQYHRVFILGLMDAILTVPVSIFLLWVTIVKDGPVLPWSGWADIHFDFSRIEQVPSIEWKLNSSAIYAVRLNQWLCAFCAFVFLCFFGFTGEARNNYASVVRRAVEATGLRKSRKRHEILPRIIVSSSAQDDSIKTK